MENGAIKGIVQDVAASYVDGKTKAQPSPNWANDVTDSENEA